MFLPFPWPSKITKSGKQTDCICPWAKETRRNQGPGWTELSCVCLSTLAVQNIRSHLYSRHRQAVTWQPSLNDNQPLKESSPHTIASTPRATTKMRRGPGVLICWFLNSYVLLLFKILKPTKSKVSGAYEI